MTTKQRNIIKKWVAALRSRKYKQGQVYLRQINKKGKERYCCLGVLCELAVEAGVIPAPTKIKSNFAYKYGAKTGALPRKVYKWAGLADNCGSFSFEDGGKSNLADQNDNGKKFETIAKLIESKPKGLFV